MRIEDYNPNLPELAERVLLGPQAEILRLIEDFNRRYRCDIKSTKTFRWSPGVSKKIREAYMKVVLDWDKKYAGICSFFNRIDSSRYYHTNMKQSLETIDSKMSTLRYQGLTFQDNTDVVVAKFQEIKEKIISQIDEVRNTYNDTDFQIGLNIIENDQTENDVYEFIFVLPNHIMKVFNAGEHLVDIKLYPVALKCKFNIYDHLNKAASGSSVTTMRLSWSGKYLSPSNKVVFPFFANHYRHEDEYTNVCFGSLQSDINGALCEINIQALVILLNQWVSRYDNQFTHPHNKINLAYIGLPKWLHDQDHFPEYISAVRQDSQKCAVPRSIAELNDKEYAIVNDTTCNDIDCQMKDKCSYWNNVVNASEERIANIAVLSSFDIYTSLMNYIDVSDVNVENTVQDTLEDEIEIEETLQAAEECTDDNLTDEQRALRWVQQTIERRNR